MKKYLFKAAVLLTLFAFGCGSSLQNRSQASVLRDAIDTPTLFQSRTGAMSEGNSCTNPMIDPRDGTGLTMVTSFGDGTGDYAVPSGKYGVERGELLRINCNTGEVVGIVRR